MERAGPAADFSLGASRRRPAEALPRTGISFRKKRPVWRGKKIIIQKGVFIVKKSGFAIAFALVFSVLALSICALGAGGPAAGTEAELRSAIDETAAGGIVALTGNITMTDTLTITKSITLDLAGFTISGSDPGSVNTVILFSPEDEATLTVTDSAGGGKITTTDTGTQPCVIRVKKGSLVQNGGVISSETTSAASQAVHLEAGTVFTMNGGTVKTNGPASGYSTAVNIKGAGAVFNLVDGTVECPKGNAVVTSAGTTFNMGGGAVNGAGNRAAIGGSMGTNTNVNITGGIITATGTGAAIGPAQHNSVSISGGTVNGKITAAMAGALNISGGTLNSVITMPTGKTAITGGIFTQTNPVSGVAGDRIAAGLTSGDTTVYAVGDENAVNVFFGGADAGDVFDILKGNAALQTDIEGILVRNIGGGAVSVNGVEVPEGEDGVLSVHPCEPAEEWRHDETGHWKNCAVCGERIESTFADHSFSDWIVVKEPTLTEKGSRERVCGICGYKQIEELPALTPAEYTVDGDGEFAWEPGDGDLVFVIQGDFAMFTGLDVNGEPLDPADYTAEPGSVIITLKAGYTANLDEGKHILTVQFKNGEARVEFSVLAEKDPPPTGYAGISFALPAMLVCAAAGPAVVLIGKKKK